MQGGNLLTFQRLVAMCAAGSGQGPTVHGGVTRHGHADPRLPGWRERGTGA